MKKEPKRIFLSLCSALIRWKKVTQEAIVYNFNPCCEFWICCFTTNSYKLNRTPSLYQSPSQHLKLVGMFDN